MATLNTLRTKGGWIVSIVIGLALLAFLIGDLAGGNSVFGVKEKVGKIDGASISYMEYMQKVDEYTEIRKLLSGSESMTTEEQDQLRNYVWETFIQETAIFPGLEAMGIEITEEEMYERIYGNNISPVLTNMGVFTDPQTGVYDKTAVQGFVSNLDADPTGGTRRVWRYLQDQVRQEALMSKYLALVSNMSYVSDAEATVGAARANTLYNARLVKQGYETIPDSTVKVSSSEVRKYFDAHKDLYKRSASRGVEYLVFEVSPSAKDYADAKAYVDELATEFAVSDNLQQYVTLNSHGSFDVAYYSQEQLPADVREFAFGEGVGGILGPVLSGDVYTTYRVSDRRSLPDTIGLRQMAFMPGTEKLADSIFTVLGRGGDFMALAGEYSVIPGDAADMGRISTQYIPMEIGEQIYSNRDKYVKVQNPNGTFIFDVYYRGPVSPKVQLATLVYEIEPSSATQQAAYAKASSFYTATAGLQSNFDKIAADSAYSKRTARIQAGQGQVSGMDNSREMIRWAFNSKPGNISNIMEIDNNYVIGVLTSATEDGYPAVEQVQGEIVPILIQQKKAEQLAEKMKGAASLDALAQTLSANVEEVTDLNYNAFYIPEVGVDPALIGAICGGVTEGQLSKPVKGMGGVYVVEITSKQNTEETTVDMEKVRLQAQGESGIPQRALNALQLKSNVVDGRSKYF